MKKNILIAILGVTVVALLAIHFWPGPGPIPPPPPPPPPPGPVGETNITQTVKDGKTTVVTNVVVETITVVDGVTNVVKEVAPLTRTDSRHPLEPEATKRLRNGPVIITSLFEATGKAEHASYGKAFTGSYLYTTMVQARSEVKEKDEASGRIRVVERRCFVKARDTIALKDIDMKLALDTLPLTEVRQWCVGAGSLVTAISTACGHPEIGAIAGTLTAGAEGWFRVLDKIDGTSVRVMLDAFGVKVPDNIEVFLNDRFTRMAKRELSNVHSMLQTIEGKCYIITYTQTATGLPLSVDFESEDGTPITDAEWEILRRANVFLDSNIVPDARCRVGNRWTIWADEVVRLFEDIEDGTADGKIRVVRDEDQPDGDWTIRMEQSTIRFLSATGDTAGKMEFKKGEALVDAKNASVKVLQATASGNLAKLNQARHLLFFTFVKRINGDSNLRFTLSTEPAPKNEK